MSIYTDSLRWGGQADHMGVMKVKFVNGGAWQWVNIPVEDGEDPPAATPLKILNEDAP